MNIGISNYGLCFVTDDKTISSNYVIDKIYTYENIETAKLNSIDYTFTRCQTQDGMAWKYFYVARPVKIRLIDN